MGNSGVGYSDISERVIFSSTLDTVVSFQIIASTDTTTAYWSMFIGHSGMSFCLHVAHLTRHNWRAEDSWLHTWKVQGRMGEGVQR